MSYTFDITGVLPENRVTNEQHALTADNMRQYATLFPHAAPFYAEGLVVTHRPSGRVLIEGQDYELSHFFYEASLSLNKPVYASISLNNPNLTGVIEFTRYQTIGGSWVKGQHRNASILANLITSPRITYWEQVSEEPDRFPVIDHAHDVEDLTQWNDVVSAVDKIAGAIAASRGGQAALDLHTSNQNNPHGVTKAQVGLGQVQNYPIASTGEAKLGTANNRYMTPKATKEAVEHMLADFTPPSTGGGGGADNIIEVYNFTHGNMWIPLIRLDMNASHDVAMMNITWSTRFGGIGITGLSLRYRAQNLDEPEVNISNTENETPQLAFRHLGDGRYEIYINASFDRVNVRMEVIFPTTRWEKLSLSPMDFLPSEAIRVNGYRRRYIQSPDFSRVGRDGQEMVLTNTGIDAVERFRILNVYNNQNHETVRDTRKMLYREWVTNCTEFGQNTWDTHDYYPSTYFRQRWTAHESNETLVFNGNTNIRATNLITTEAGTDYVLETTINTTGSMGNSNAFIGLVAAAIDAQGKLITIDFLRTPGGALKENHSHMFRKSEYGLVTIALNGLRKDAEFIYSTSAGVKWGDGAINPTRDIETYNHQSHGWGTLGQVTMRVERKGDVFKFWIADGSSIPSNAEPIYTLDINTNSFLKGLFKEKESRCGFTVGYNANTTHFKLNKLPYLKRSYVLGARQYYDKGDGGWNTHSEITDVNRLVYSEWDETLYHIDRLQYARPINIAHRSMSPIKVLVP